MGNGRRRRRKSLRFDWIKDSKNQFMLIVAFLGISGYLFASLMTRY